MTIDQEQILKSDKPHHPFTLINDHPGSLVLPWTSNLMVTFNRCVIDLYMMLDANVSIYMY